MSDRFIDTVLEGMASELHAALVRVGADPKNPPSPIRPPEDRAWDEYQRRGGDHYSDASTFMQDLVQRVGEIEEEHVG